MHPRDISVAIASACAQASGQPCRCSPPFLRRTWFWPKKADVNCRAEKALCGDKKPMAAGKIKLDVPQIAENGLVVPVGYRYRKPDERGRLCEGRAHISPIRQPGAGHRQLQGSRRLRQSLGRDAHAARADAEHAVCHRGNVDGKLYTAKAEVKVTIGGLRRLFKRTGSRQGSKAGRQFMEARKAQPIPRVRVSRPTPRRANSSRSRR